MDFTLNDLKALKAFTDIYNKHQKFIGVRTIPELERRWFHISRAIRANNMEAILGNKCISFADEDRFNSFVSHIDDLLEDAELKRKVTLSQIEASRSAYVSSRSAFVSACGTLISLVIALLGVLHIL